jgi:NAD(P)-dependent dehydrogenase (short-subunit alcohol dehydrogenase family)
MFEGMDTFLKNQTAVVTGGTRGIGYAIALELARAGANVLICGRTETGVADAIIRLQAEAGEGAGAIEGRAADVSKWNEVEVLFQYCASKWEKLDILVNNAGLGIFRPVAELTPEEWRRVIDLNLSGLYYCCHAALPLLRAAGEGYVFNISSLAGKNPFAGGAAYNASKFGVNGFSEAMMLDHRQEGIRVTSIMPGSVATEFGGVPGVTKPGGEWKIQAADIAQILLSLLRLPARTLVSRVEVRPSKPPR